MNVKSMIEAIEESKNQKKMFIATIGNLKIVIKDGKVIIMEGLPPTLYEEFDPSRELFYEQDYEEPNGEEYEL